AERPLCVDDPLGFAQRRQISREALRIGQMSIVAEEVHAVATTPAQRLGVLFALLHPTVSAFPERVVGSTCALSFSRLAQRSLALRPAHSRCHQFVTR